MKLKDISLILFVILIQSVSANNIIIDNINEKYNFPKNRVNCMTQDSKGFLWFGMVNGLYKFDLNAFTKFSLNKDYFAGFPELDIKAIAELSPGLLLIGSNKGLFVFNSNKESFDTIRCEYLKNFPELYVESICISDSNTLWIGTHQGLLKIKAISDLKFEFIERIDNTKSFLLSNEVLEIRKSENGTIWFLTAADIGYIHPATQEISTFNLYSANANFIFDKNKVLQSTFGSGLLVFNMDSMKYENIKANKLLNQSKLRYTYKDSQHKYWMSISNVGLLLLDSLNQQEELVLISKKNEAYADLNSDVIYEIFETDDGAIWLCTEEGINMITKIPDMFMSITSPSSVNTDFTIGVRALCNTNDSIIWIGSIGDGLLKYNTKSKLITEIPIRKNGEKIGQAIQSIIQDTDQNLWLGTEGDGVIKLTFDNGFNEPSKVINYKAYPPQSFPEKTLLNDYVMCMLKDREHNIWIGTWFGLSLFKYNEINKKYQDEAVIQNFTHAPDNENLITHNTIMSLTEDKEGNIWVGTLAGINKITPTSEGYKFENDFFDNQGEPLVNKKILDLLEDISGNIWFSTQSGGLALLNVKSGVFKEFNSSNGFHDHIVNSILQDSVGILWLGTNNGLCRYDAQKGTYNMYHSENGLLTEDFFYRSSCEAENLLYFGGNKGIVYYNPYNIVPVGISPKLEFTNFKLFNETVDIRNKKSPLNKHISYAREINLNYKQNYITFEFAALNYKHQKEIHYTCQLVGLEKTWNNLRQERKITYTNLKPGDYEFKVRAYTSGQRSNVSEIKIPINISPPFWSTMAAYIVYILIVVFIIIYSYRFFLNQEKKKHGLALERMNAKRVHELDMMKLQFYTNISHELRTPLTLISAPLETLLNENIDTEKSKKYHQLIFKNVQRLRRLINQLLDMRKIEEGHLKIEWSQGDVIDYIKKVFVNFEIYAEKRNIKFALHCPKIKLNTYFDADKLEKVIFNLISNAFKYTPDDGKVILKVQVNHKSTNSNFETGYYEIRIIDSGVGIPKEAIRNIYKPFHQVKKNKPIGAAGSGIGLSLTRELVTLQKGEIFVDSEEDKGSVFTIKLPIVKVIPTEELEKNHKNLDSETEKRNIKLITEEIQKTRLKPHVLIVEDDNELRKFISGELVLHYHVQEATNGEEGYEIAIKLIPDLIVSDVMMDKMDGIEMCRKIKSDERTSHIPVILLTARHSQEIVQNSFDLGADDYITKPFNISILKTRINNLIEQRRKLRKLFRKNADQDISNIVHNKMDSQFLDKLNKIIEDNIQNTDFTPTSLASDMALSKMQLYRKVSALTNQTVYNYIRTIRMKKAAGLLLTTDMQIAEVAFMVGYMEPSNFTKCFNREFNQSPSEFIKSNRK